MLPQKYINMQIRLFIDTLYIMRKPVYAGMFIPFDTHFAEIKMVYQIIML